MPKAALFSLILWAFATGVFAADVPEDVYRGELLTYPGPWAFQIHGPGIILTFSSVLFSAGQVNPLGNGPHENTQKYYVPGILPEY